jgi:hypothetical protein
LRLASSTAITCTNNGLSQSQRFAAARRTDLVIPALIFLFCQDVFGLARRPRRSGRKTGQHLS